MLAGLATCLLLAACEQQPVTAPATPKIVHLGTSQLPHGQGLGYARPRGVCRPAAGAPTRLVVLRRDAFPQNHIRFTFPARRVIRDPAWVAAVWHALCALPATPNRVIPCPMDWGITYRLQFSGPLRRFAPVTVNATGCMTVHGLGSPRWIIGSPRFWATLATAMGVTGPAYPTLRGEQRP